MKKHLFHFYILPLSILVIVIPSCFGQSGITEVDSNKQLIINVSKYKKGIYRSFEEFKYNSPGTTAEFIHDDQSLYMYDEDKGKNKKINKKNYWGFCNGEDVFYNHDGKICLLENLDRYCYFEASHFYLQPSLGIGPILITDDYQKIFQNPYQTHGFIVSIKTGKAYFLSAYVVEQILDKSDDKLLLDLHMGSKSKVALKEIIRQYNEGCEPYTE